MGRIFTTRAQRDRYLAAYADYVAQLDAGAREPKGALRDVKRTHYRNRTMQFAAAELWGFTRMISMEAREKFEGFLNKGEQ